MRDYAKEQQAYFREANEGNIEERSKKNAKIKEFDRIFREEVSTPCRMQIPDFDNLMRCFLCWRPDGKEQKIFFMGMDANGKSVTKPLDSTKENVRIYVAPFLDKFYKERVK